MTKTNTSDNKKPNRRGSESLRPRRALYVGGTSLEVWSRKTGKQQTKKRANASTASRPKRASEQSRENPKSARGPEWHPEETPEQNGRRGQEKKKKEKQQHVRGGVWCPVSRELYLFKEKGRTKRKLAVSYISSKKKGEWRETTNDVANPDPKTERTRQQKKQDLTWRELF